MKILLLVLVVMAAVAAFLWMRRPAGERAAGRKPLRTPDPDGHGLVQLRAGPGACNLARQQAGNAYERAEQPRLPLPGCRADRCLCRFEGIVDRRRRVRRETSDRRESVRFGAGQTDRRSGRDRRTGGGDPWRSGV